MLTILTHQLLWSFDGKILLLVWLQQFLNSDPDSDCKVKRCLPYQSLLGTFYILGLWVDQIQPRCHKSNQDLQNFCHGLQSSSGLIFCFVFFKFNVSKPEIQHNLRTLTIDDMFTCWYFTISGHSCRSYRRLQRVQTLHFVSWSYIQMYLIVCSCFNSWMLFIQWYDHCPVLTNEIEKKWFLFPEVKSKVRRRQ